MSSSMLMASENTTSLNSGEDVQTTRNNDSEHHQTSARRSSTSSTTRRRATRANEGYKKKQPQRGMGVAQLERLRLQERWKKITQINSTTSTVPLPSTALDASLLFAEPKAPNTIPVHLPKFCGLGSGGAGLNLMQPGYIVPKDGNGGSLLFHGQGLVPSHDDVFPGYLYGIGNSKELSSTPNVVKCYPDHCADCHKKKRTLLGENLMFNEGKSMYTNLPSIAGCDFTGLNVGSNGQNAKGGGNGDLEKKATFLYSGTSAALGFCNKDQGEVGTVEKKGSSGSSSSSGVPNPNALMEYEFFPGKDGCRSYGTSHNELLMMKKLMMGNSSESCDAAVIGGEVAAAAASSCFAKNNSTSTTNTPTGGASVDASTSIDLSLRLSY